MHTKTLLGRVQFLAVKHTHEGNTELHIVTPTIDMKSGKAFNIAPPGQKTKILNEDFTKLTNDRYGWDQVIENPFKLALKSFDSKVPKQKHYKERAAKVSIVVKDLVMNGRINNREDLCKFFEDVGLKVEGFWKSRIVTIEPLLTSKLPTLMAAVKCILVVQVYFQCLIARLDPVILSGSMIRH